MNNMMRKNNNRGGNKHRSNSSGGGQRRYNNNSSGGGNRGGANDGQNLQRQKHHATQQLGKYSDMARNAQINGDRVDVEYYLQHVDHYTRVLTDIAAVEAERFAHTRESQIIPGGPNDPSAQHNDGHQQNQESNGDTGQQGEEQQSSSSHEGGDQQRQQRPHRQPRREHSDNGAAEANSNTQDIPLPDSMIPPI